MAWLVLIAATFVYAALVVVATLFPLPIQNALIQYERTAPRESPWVDLVPIVGMANVLGTTLETALRQLAGNVLLFVPLGFMAPLLLGARASAARVLALALAVSTTIEGLQLAVSGVLGYPYRLASVDDIILNALGAGVGYLVFLAVRPLLQPILDTSVSCGSQPPE